uniref:Galactosylgalactosylxylosylprotein 3-beta-glucuronosyltransferase n=2 Tax=Culicoides sonorensis TaxID=179676 RepID=A0A336MAY7_CULSO
MRTAQKMFLTFILSSACILVYQYQLSRARFISQDLDRADGDIEVQNLNIVKRLLSSNGGENSTTTTTTTTVTTPTIKLVNYTKNNKNNTIAQLKQQYLVDSNTATNTKLNNDNGNRCTCDQKDATNSERHLPPLYVITPTYHRPQWLAELTRLGYTLKHVPNLVWLVVEDAPKPSEIVTKLLKKFNIPFEHMAAQMPEKYRKLKVKPRGVSNRLRALDWIRANATDGVLYFADDDNTYDVDIFTEMRFTKKVSMWPVGLVGKYGVSSPIVKNGTIIGFYDGWVGGRKFPVDMAGFAVNVKFFLSRKNATMPYKAGFEEDGFLKSLNPISLHDIELLASNCTEILTWHTQTRKYGNATPVDMKKYSNTNLVKLNEFVI